jgi:DNA-binding LacI/PurR family transcriptional regulator
MSERKRPTLATVAAAVGVSAMTVSNAFNRPEKLSADLRERILGVASELGYLGPDPMARSLRSGRVGALGVVLGESLGYAFEDPAAMQLLRGIASSCADAAAGLSLIPTTGTGADGRLISAAAVDALILFGLPDDHHLVKASLQRGVRLVSCGGPELTDHPFVGIDEVAAGKAAAEHLRDSGHRHLAVLSLRLDARGRSGKASIARQRAATFRVARERLGGYRAGWTAGGRRWADVLVHETPLNSQDSGYRATLELLTGAPRTTAILAMSDELARGALHAAKHLGRAVPKDLSILGWDDTTPGLSSPALTTIRQSLYDHGRLAGRLALDPPESTAPVFEPWELVVRESTSRPPGGRRRSARPAT